MNTTRYHKSNVAIRIEQRAIRRRKRAIRNFILVFFVSVFSIMLGGIIVKANDGGSVKVASHKYYSSIMIDKNDTLWELATKYAPEGTSTKEYVKELKSLNGLKDDTIKQGQNLFIYYYSDEIK